MSNFDKVLIVSPDYNAVGGIATVVLSYKNNIPGLRFAKSNSRHGFIMGVVSLLLLFIRIPIERILGRKIVHIHSASGKSFVRKSLLIYWSRLFGYKIVFHSHGGKMKEYICEVGIRRVNRVLDKCDAIIALTYGWKYFFEKTFPNKKTYVLYNTSGLCPESVKERCIKSNKIRYMFIGEIGEQKGVTDLIRAIKLLSKRHKNSFEVVLAGSGDLDRYERMIREEGVSDIVSMVGIVVGKKKIDLFRSVNVLVLPSYAEGAPVCIIEGLTFGIPAIATNVGGIPEIIENNKTGIIIEAGDVKSLALAMEKFIENDTILEVYSRNALAASKIYSMEKIRNDLDLIYEDVLAK